MADPNVFPVPAPLTGPVNVVLQALVKWLKLRLVTMPRAEATSPTGAPWQFRWGTADVSFNAGGDGTINYTAFPTATVFAIAQSTNPAVNVFSTLGYAANGFNIHGTVGSVVSGVSYLAVGY